MTNKQKHFAYAKPIIDTTALTAIPVFLPANHPIVCIVMFTNLGQVLGAYQRKNKQPIKFSLTKSDHWSIQERKNYCPGLQLPGHSS